VTGAERVHAAFESARAEGRRAALMPYMMGGFPDLDRSLEIGRAYVEAGADLIELGVPFSDPLADGPVIHAAGVAALATGVRVADVLTLGRALSADVPVVLMCYVNLILAQGYERFVASLAAAEISGLIVPDLPIDESDEALAACDAHGVALVPLAAPTSDDGRLGLIGARARGFVYAVSLTGTTGERAALDGSLAGVLARVRAHTSVPVAVGFGIGSPEQALAAAQAGADGVIIGSRLVRAAGESEDPAAAVGSLVREFAAALGGMAVG
jgi:tryptophan synthase alpha chain